MQLVGQNLDLVRKTDSACFSVGEIAFRLVQSRLQAIGVALPRKIRRLLAGEEIECV